MRTALMHALLAVTCALPASAELDMTHGAWTALLREHVVLLDAQGHASRADYAGFARDRAALRAYLASLAAVKPAAFAELSRAAQMAFLINAYNAATIELILTEYPKHASIRDYGSLLRSPWRKPFVKLLGETLTLDQIEHERLRGPRGTGEPRLHFALNCASIGCPMLREEAYVGARLEAQLEEQAVRFLSDRSRNRYDLKTGDLTLSKIFDWYAGDFERGDVHRFLLRYAGALADSPEERRTFSVGVSIRFGGYDWRLNDVRTP